MMYIGSAAAGSTAGALASAMVCRKVIEDMKQELNQPLGKLPMKLQLLTFINVVTIYPLFSLGLFTFFQGSGAAIDSDFLGNKYASPDLTIQATSHIFIAQNEVIQYTVYAYTDREGRDGFFTKVSNNRWVNDGAFGDQYQFTELSNNGNYIELYDPLRKIFVRIFANGVNYWSIGQGWNRGSPGKWMQ